MRISDWSSDVCSSDLETEGLSTSRLAADDDHLRREEFGMSIGSLFSRPAKLALVVGVSLASVAGIVHAQSATSAIGIRSEEHTPELQSLMLLSYAVFCLKQKKVSVLTPESKTLIIHQLLI